MSSPEDVAGHRDQIDDIEHASAGAAVRPRPHHRLAPGQTVGRQVDEAADQQCNQQQVGAHCDLDDRVNGGRQYGSRDSSEEGAARATPLPYPAKRLLDLCEASIGDLPAGGTGIDVSDAAVAIPRISEV